MNRYRAGFALFIAAAMLLAIPIVFSNAFEWWQRDLFFIAAAACAILAQLLYFNVRMNKLDVKWQRKLSELHMPDFDIPESMKDDLEDIKQGRITRTQFTVIATIIGALSSLCCIAIYDKWGADWYGFNVILVSLLVAIIVAFMITRTDWFQDQSFRTPLKVLAIPAVALVVCIGLGLYMTEPIELGGPTAYEVGHDVRAEQGYDYAQTRAHYYYYSWGGGGSSSSTSSTSGASLSGFNCKGKGCGYVILVIILVIVVIILIVGSAFVAHFWVFASIFLLTIMVMIAIHEVRVMEERRMYGRSWE